MLIFTKPVLGYDQVVAVRSCLCGLVYMQGKMALTQLVLETKQSGFRMLGSSLTYGFNPEDNQEVIQESVYSTIHALSSSYPYLTSFKGNWLPFP